jgi:hypothetical protein
LRKSAARLAAVVAKRGEASAALGSAYRRFGAEAEYDAAADLEDSVSRATSSVNGFAQAVGLAPLVPVVAEVAKVAAGIGADRAQRRRLLVANTRLRQLSATMAAALGRERPLHVAVDTLVGTLNAETATNLVRAGLLDPAPTLAGLAENVGIPTGGTGSVRSAIAGDPLLEAAASVAALARPAPTQPDAFTAAISALEALDVQHASYAAGRPVSAQDAVGALDRLAAIAQASAPQEDR